MSSNSPRISAREDGFTLLELMVASALLMMVVGAMLGVFSGMQRFAAREVGRSEAMDAVRLGMNRMTKEVRQATTVRATSTATLLEMDTYVNGVATLVKYSVVGTNLKRTVGGSAVTLVERLTGAPIFTYSENPAIGLRPSVVTISLNVHPAKFAADGVIIALESEVKLRNR